MARTKYKEHLTMVEAIQNKGDNYQELVDFAGDAVYKQGEEIWMKLPGLSSPEGDVQLETTDWIVDDPSQGGFLTKVTNKMFLARFDASPQ